MDSNNTEPKQTEAKAVRRPIMIPTLIGYGNNPDTGYRTPIMSFKDLDPYGERYSAWQSWLRSTKKPRKRRKQA